MAARRDANRSKTGTEFYEQPRSQGLLVFKMKTRLVIPQAYWVVPHFRVFVVAFVRIFWNVSVLYHSNYLLSIRDENILNCLDDEYITHVINAFTYG